MSTATPQPELATPFDDGALYDIMYDGLDYGIDFYLELARAARGPVLDVCCGTGRVMLPCLEGGLDVDGVDLFPGMLSELRKKAAARGYTPRLVESDMASFQIDRRYALVMIPFNAFVHNLTSDAQLATLGRCREHLLPGGLLAFDAFFPSREYINVPDHTRVLEGERPHPVTGLPMRMFDTRSFDRVRQLQFSLNELELLDAAGNVVVTQRSQTTTCWIYKSEMELLLRLAGFPRWEVCGGFDRRPLVHETDGMVVLAWKD